MPLWIGNPFHLILWIKEFLCNQLWHVKWNCCLSNEPVLNTSVPQGRAISSFLLSIYTDEIMCNNNCFVLIKHADNAAQEACLIPSQSQQKKTMLQSWQLGLTLATSDKTLQKTQWDSLLSQEEQLASPMSSSSQSMRLIASQRRWPAQYSHGRWTSLTQTYSVISAAEARGTRCQ